MHDTLPDNAWRGILLPYHQSYCYNALTLLLHAALFSVQIKENMAAIDVVPKLTDSVMQRIHDITVEAIPAEAAP